jgi:hypothetical protein
VWLALREKDVHTRSDERLWRRIGKSISNLVALFRYDLGYGMRSPSMMAMAMPLRRSANNALCTGLFARRWLIAN